MWPGSVATRFGSTEWWPCAGNNKIAVFPTFEQGIAAQFYLWATKYSGMPLRDAIYKWSGHNSSPQYADFLSKRIPGITMDTVLSPEFFHSEDGWKFMKAQSQWEAGKPYPVTDEQWQAGQALAFGDLPIPAAVKPTPKPKPKSKPRKKPVAPVPLEGEGFFTTLFKKLSGQ